MLPVAHWTTRYLLNAVVVSNCGLGQGLALQELVKAGSAHLAPDAGLPVAAERRIRRVPEPAVATRRARPTPPRHRQRGLVFGADHGPGQTVDGVVGDADRVVVPVVRQYDEDR